MFYNFSDFLAKALLMSREVNTSFLHTIYFSTRFNKEVFIAKTLNKIAALSGNAPGFIGNRMLGGYTRQAGEIILQGATPYQVDNAILQFGMPMGPFQMNDLVGLDLGWRARKLSGMAPEDVPITARIADKLCEMERFGQKTFLCTAPCQGLPGFHAWCKLAVSRALGLNGI